MKKEIKIYRKREGERKTRKEKRRKKCAVYGLTAIMLADLLDMLPFCF